MRLIVLLVVFMVIPTTGYGEPSPTVRYLMDEPVTMFDWGLYRLRRIIDQFQFENLNLHNIHSYITYDWDQNRLRIVFYVQTKETVDKASSKKICKNITAKISSTFGGEIRDKGLRRNISIATLFEHRAFENRDKPDNFMEEIEKITKIEVSVFTRKTINSPANIKILSCESPLIGGKPLFLD